MTINNDPEVSQIQGPTGNFEIAFCGATREGLRYFYRNDRHGFYFYADIVASSPAWTTNIDSTSGFRAEIAEQERIKSDIKFFFNSRHYLHPERAGSSNATNMIVSFNWGVAP